MEPALDHRDAERPAWDFFLSIPELDRDLLPHDSVKGSQALQPLFEFSGRLRRMRRDAVHQAGHAAVRRPDGRRQRHRLLVDLRRQPADDPVDASNGEGRGPAWSNSLFEDNAEFGLGLRLGMEAQTALAHLAARAARAPSSAPQLIGVDPGRRPGVRGRHPCPTRAGRRAARRAATARRHRRRRRRGRPPPAGARRQPDPQGRVDHRR